MNKKPEARYRRKVAAKAKTTKSEPQKLTSKVIKKQPGKVKMTYEQYKEVSEQRIAELQAQLNL